MEFYRHKMRILYILAAFFLSFILLSWPACKLFIVPLLPLGASPLRITIDKSSSAYEFAHLLQKNHCIDSASIFVLMIRLEGLTKQLKAGVYQIIPGESAMQLLHRVVRGDVLTFHFTIIAGTNQHTISHELIKTEHLEYHSEDWAFIKSDYANAEGLLLAETYQYQALSTSRSLLEQAHQDLMRYLDHVWNERAPNLPYKTPYELLIAASIIEKESANADDRKLISGVVVNRLKRGMPLQMDPTVVYALGSAYKGKLSHHDLMIASPYNTYLNRGLPPTPIAMVGKESLMAAAHPRDSNFLYFVARGDGSHQFSETYIQQIQAIHQYQHKDY